MDANSFGQIFKIHSFGESHGSAMGVVIEGCPAGLEVNENLLRYNLNRRRPGQSAITTQRKEADEFQILSGVHQHKTLGTPIAVCVQNLGQASKDYHEIEQALADGAKPLRPGHADDLWRKKYAHSDVRGGGRSSGRETLSRVIGGSFAQMLLNQLSPETKVLAFTEAIHEIKVSCSDQDKYLLGEFDIESNSLRMPSDEAAEKALKLIELGKTEGKSFGGIAQVVIQNPPQY